MHSKGNTQKKNLYCEKVLHYLVIYCEPSELMLYLIEQMELSSSDYCFFSLLNVIKISLFRCKNPLLVIDMCIDNGKNLQLIISNICILKHGANTDLLEISDQIIVILNFILFLIIRDKKNSYNQAINTLLLIEHILFRIYDFIDIKLPNMY
ncbi:PREDICTED: uncharacterized protein LOC105360863 [Ceratosolen solmsi marchali]|uniref:Uncharacterized protein LOC105360863 n=1 Tax=Ceratosolen solmsi marchali TaxID=326594 RepID=A0AAJ6YDP8_9HYME|nr:PREDICTED: uncharacterized protein LOC105360863 [Ceratosolen solmsi marchali]